MEKQTYRENLMILREIFPNKIILNVSDCCKALGVSRNTIHRYVNFDKKKRISIGDLARQISQ